MPQKNDFLLYVNYALNKPKSFGEWIFKTAIAIREIVD